MQLGGGYAGSTDANQHLAVAGYRLRELGRDERGSPARIVYLHGSHPR